MAEPPVWAAHLAAVTTTLKLASGVLVLPQREPVLLAKQAATVAVLSGGRLILGAGTGWLHEEFAILGADFDHRVARMDEHVAAMRALWAEDVADFDGALRVVHGQRRSRPDRRAAPCRSSSAESATLPLAGRDGSATVRSRPRRRRRRCPACSIIAHNAAADADATRRHSRSPSTTRPCGTPPQPPSVMATWRKLSLHRVLLSPNTFDQPRSSATTCRAFGEEIIDHARD